MKDCVRWAVLLMLVSAAAAQTPVAGKANPKPRRSARQAAPAVTAKDFQALREALADQQRQIEQLREQLQQRDEAVRRVQDQANQAQARAAEAQQKANDTAAKAEQAGDTANAVRSEVSDLKTNSTTLALNLQEEQKKAKPDAIELANGKLRIGGVFFGDYAMYYKTGFGPQFLTQVNSPGPGNDSYNSFDISRAYVNFFFLPSPAITLRITPNLYRQIGTAPASKFGNVSAIGSNVDGELAFRLKYAYVDFNTLFAGSEHFADDKLTIGQQTNPLVDWEETLYGYRFVNLVPWNYLSLSSTQTGVSLKGPIKFGGKQYLDYAIGAFTNASFRQLEQSEKKQAMARLSWYPWGASSTYQGLGLTGFMDYGFTNVAPDTDASTPLYRVAALAHYTSKDNSYGIAGEYDYGRNAFTSGNLFSGSGPQDEFGVGVTSFAGFDALAKALLNGRSTKQQGVAFLGHAAIPKSKFTLFGTYHYFQPNTRVTTNPLDFQRVVAGISYKYNNRLRFALSSQNLLFTHDQFTFPAAQLAQFSPSLAAKNPNGIPNAVPKNTQAILLNVEFTF